jgi:hypothetical protein
MFGARVVGLEASVVLKNPKTGETVTFDMTEAEFEPIGMGVNGAGRGWQIFQIEGRVDRKRNGSPGVKVTTAPSKYLPRRVRGR